MAFRRVLDREINRALGIDFEAREALKNDRYAVSLVVLHKLMICYLNELSLNVIGNHFEEKILELKREKTKMISQNFSIYKAVVQFFNEGGVFANDTGVLLELFQGLLVKIMREMGLNDDLQRLKYKMEKTNHEDIKAIGNLIKYMRCVEFEEDVEDHLEGEVENFGNEDKEREVLAEMVRRKREENKFFEKLQKEEEDERKTKLKRKNEKRLEQGQSSKRGGGARR